MYGPDPAPTRITIDFSGSVHPARAWILGRVDETGGRVELLAFERPAGEVALPESPATEPVAAAAPAALSAPDGSDCTCPEFCERDHANE